MSEKTHALFRCDEGHTATAPRWTVTPECKTCGSMEFIRDVENPDG